MSDDADAKAKEQAALVPLLLIMTVVTGAVDAVSILRLGHVFVANMTGNVVFLGFALAGAAGFSVTASLVALAAFLGGAALGGRVVSAAPRRMLMQIAAAQAALAAVAAIIGAAADGRAAQYAMTVLLAAGMGGQNAVARRLAVPDMTTTVLTLTLTGLAADQPDLSGPRSRTVRRLGAVTAMLVGAAAGALLVLHSSTSLVLGIVAAILAAVAVAGRVAGVDPPAT